jgi:hypothetical protein
MSTEASKNWFNSESGKQVLADWLKGNQATTTPIQTKFIVTTDKSLPNDKGVTINLKKGDILQGVSTSKWGTPENDAGGYGLTFTDKAGNKFSISTGGRLDRPFYEDLVKPIFTDKSGNKFKIIDGKNVYENTETTEPMSEPAKSSTPSTSKLFGAYNKNLILVVLAVAGYFAYKKFKK